MTDNVISNKCVNIDEDFVPDESDSANKYVENQNDSPKETVVIRSKNKIKLSMVKQICIHTISTSTSTGTKAASKKATVGSKKNPLKKRALANKSNKDKDDDDDSEVSKIGAFSSGKKHKQQEKTIKENSM